MRSFVQLMADGFIDSGSHGLRMVKEGFVIKIRDEVQSNMVDAFMVNGDGTVTILDEDGNILDKVINTTKQFEVYKIEKI